MSTWYMRRTSTLIQEQDVILAENATEAVRLAAPCGLTKQELTEMLELLWEE